MKTLSPPLHEIQTQLDHFVESTEAAIYGIAEQEYYYLPLDPEIFSRGHLCGTSSEITKRFLQKNGVKSKLIKTDLEVPAPFDEILNDLPHVMVLAEDGATDYIIDPTYSQFLCVVGIDANIYDYQDDNESSNLFPPEKSLVIPTDSIDLAAEWAADVAVQARRKESYSLRFQQRHGYTVGSRENSLWKKLQFEKTRVSHAQVYSIQQLKGLFKAIWDIENYEEYQSSREVIEFVDLVEANGIIDTPGVYL